MKNIIKAAFPFLITLLLWRLSAPFWNPAGILAIAPIFYYSFVRARPWFAPFAALICFLIDYNGGTLLFWTFAYCLFYAANGLQNRVDITRQRLGALPVFMAFFGICVLILTLWNFSFANLARGLWLALWTGMAYILISGAPHD